MKKAVAIICTLLIIVASYGIVIGSKRYSKNEKELTISAQKDKEKIGTGEITASSLNFYQELHEKADINALILGDSMGQSNGSSTTDKKWYNLITKDVKTKYNSTITTDLITGGGTTGIRSFVELNKSKATKKYDIAYLCFGQNDQWNMTPDKFGLFYESIIIKLKKINPNIEIIPIIESSFRKDNGYTNVIKNLSSHYNLQYADTIKTFVGAPEKYEDLTMDTEIPNDKGYSYYATTIEKIIDSNYKINKKTNLNYSALYKDTNKLTKFVFDTTPDLNNGFSLKNEIVGEKTLDSVTFNTTSSVAILHFLKQTNGGKFIIYLDGKFLTEVDTKSSYETSYSSLISDNLMGNHKIKIEVSNINSGQSVKILGLVTN